MAEVVLSDAQMGMFQVLRPPPNFESIYDGIAGSIPIAFPGTLAPEAGKPGFDPNLLAGIPVPLGSRLLVQIPMTIDMYTPVAAYAYQFVFRTRNQTAVAEAILAGRQASPYHLPSEAPGRKEFSLAPGELFFIPGNSDVEVFEQPEPPFGAALLNVKQQRYVPQITSAWVQPRTPGGDAAVWQQGTYQFSSATDPSGPSWLPLWIDSSGDEMMILAYKLNPGVNWDFGGVDRAFSNTFGTNNGTLPENPNVGILLSSGTMGG